jgi:hypothetical protein
VVARASPAIAHDADSASNARITASPHLVFIMTTFHYLLAGFRQADSPGYFLLDQKAGLTKCRVYVTSRDNADQLGRHENP